MFRLFTFNTFFLPFLAKEEEKNKLLKRSEELKAERVELEAKAKELSNAIMVSKRFCPLLHVNLKSDVLPFKRTKTPAACLTKRVQIAFVSRKK